jgi:hypothetical protein
MVIYTVATRIPDNDVPLGERISELFPTDHYELGRGHWLVAFEGTSRELYTKLFPEPELPLPSKNIVVFAIGGYWGQAPGDMWEWMANKIGKKSA